MIVENTSLDGVKIITPTVFEDERGYFFESYKEPVFQKNDLPVNFVQDNEVKSTKGVLRGLHYQFNRPQGKLVRIISGSILDVAVDIRKGSPTFGQSEIVHLTAENNKMLYIPEGFAHGFQTITSDCEMIYLHTAAYVSDAEAGIDALDPRIGIEWQLPISERSARDNLHNQLTSEFLGLSL